MCHLMIYSLEFTSEDARSTRCSYLPGL